MVRGTGRLLGHDMLALRAQRHQLLARQLVAEPGRLVGGEHPGVQVSPTTGRSRVGECWLRALGASSRLVQQHRVECRTAHRQTVSACN